MSNKNEKDTKTPQGDLNFDIFYYHTVLVYHVALLMVGSTHCSDDIDDDNN
jgi:hypothetical protein